MKNNYGSNCNPPKKDNLEKFVINCISVFSSQNKELWKISCDHPCSNQMCNNNEFPFEFYSTGMVRSFYIINEDFNKKAI